MARALKRRIELRIVLGFLYARRSKSTVQHEGLGDGINIQTLLDESTRSC